MTGPFHIWGECRILSELGAAVRFLTILPCGRARENEGELLRRSALAFPFVGLILGGILAGTNLLFARVFPGPPVAALTLALNVVLTGALHIDGFADTCDGVFSHRRGNDLRSIMKDSRLGVMGATALALLLILKFALLLRMHEPAAELRFSGFPFHIMLMPVAGRWTLILTAYSYRLSGKGESHSGMGLGFARSVGLKETILAGSFTALVVFVSLGLFGLAALASTSLVVLWSMKYPVRLNQGISGDILGAASESAEAAWLIICTLPATVGG